MKEIVISKNDGGQRADKFLIKYFSKAPKGFVYKMLRKKGGKKDKPFGVAAFGHI